MSRLDDVPETRDPTVAPERYSSGLATAFTTHYSWAGISMRPACRSSDDKRAAGQFHPSRPESDELAAVAGVSPLLQLCKGRDLERLIIIAGGAAVFWFCFGFVQAVLSSVFRNGLNLKGCFGCLSLLIVAAGIVGGLALVIADLGSSKEESAKSTDAQLNDHLVNELTRSDPSSMHEAMDELIQSNSMQEVWRRDREREAAATASFEERRLKEVAQAKRDAMAEERRQRVEDARLERLTDEALHPKPLPPDPQQQADIEELDRLAGRK